MTEIERAEQRAMHCLSEWVNALLPKFNVIEMSDLKQRMTAAFREYETEISELRAENIRMMDAESLARKIGEIDFTKYGDYFYWKFGGDGDNGEVLIAQLKEALGKGEK